MLFCSEGGIIATRWPQALDIASIPARISPQLGLKPSFANSFVDFQFSVFNRDNAVAMC